MFIEASSGSYAAAPAKNGTMLVTISSLPSGLRSTLHSIIEAIDILT